MNYKTTLIIPALLLASIAAFANVYGAIRGVVHDPQHRPVSGCYGDAEGEGVRLGQDRQHRHQRRVSAQCRLSGRLLRQCRQPRLRSNGSGLSRSSRGTVPVVHFQLRWPRPKKKSPSRPRPRSLPPTARLPSLAPIPCAERGFQRADKSQPAMAKSPACDRIAFA
jgi:hypothetical protein